MDIVRIKKRKAFYEGLLDKLYAAYAELIDGKVQSYTIDDRQLTRFDLKALGEEIEEVEAKIAELEALEEGKQARKTVAVVPHDW